MSILRVARNVSNLQKLGDFYIALGFRPLGPAQEDAALAARLRVQRARSLRLALGSRELELTELSPPGTPYPRNAKADARMFQHIAVLTPDINAAVARALSASAFPISEDGPVRLPPEAGGVVAWKFRDPDHHPVEFIERQGESGYDHSAIAVTDTEIAEIFYGQFGLRSVHNQTNRGSEQARLDGLKAPSVHISTLRAESGPGLELLNYGRPTSALPVAATDIAADRLVLSGAVPGLSRDPDGHFVLTERG